MQGATGLSNIGGQGYNQNLQTNQLLAGYGQQQQGAEQQRLNTQYQDFLNEQNMPYKQLGFMANTASAAPTANLGSTMYQAAPSTLSQVGGLGATALGAFGASGGFKANGGMIGRYAKGGLVRSRPQGLVALAIHSMA
jgi:beta-lactamase class A